jgi:hypothetical protein
VVNPQAEDAYWRDAYTTSSYYTPGYTYDDYAPAYKLGYTGASKYPGAYDESESHLANEWDTVKGQSRLTWQQAKSASRAAWDKVDRKV